MQHNPYLELKNDVEATKRAGTGYIETPDDKFMNMVWQTRSEEPGEYELALSEAMATLFSNGVEELKDIVSGLNATAVRPPSIESWTSENFQSEMKRLGE